MNILNDKNKIKKISSIILLLIIPSIVSFVIPSFPALRWQYLSWGHDLNYHIQAIKGQSFTMQYNIFPIYLNPFANSGAGDCRYIVYPYLFTYIPAFFYNMTNNIQVSINILIIFVNVMTYISTYKASMIIFEDKVASVFASAFYLLCFYKVFNIYDRQAMGEYIALAFTPLVIGGFYDIFFGDKKRWYYLVIGLTCLIQSHVITSFYYILLVIVVSIICIPFMVKDKNILKYYILSGILTILLNLWYLVPFLQYYIEAEIDITSFGQYVKAFNIFIDNFIIDYRISSRFYNCLGFESIIAMIVMPLLLVLIYVVNKVKDKDYVIDKKYITAVIFLVIFYYYFIVSIGLLNIGPLENLYARQQFLYRELGRGLPFLAIAFGYAVSHICDNKIFKTLLIYVLLIVSTYTTVTYISTKMENEKFDAEVSATLPDYLFYSGSDGDSGDSAILSEEEYEAIRGENATGSEAKRIIPNDLHKKESSGMSLNVSDESINIDSISKGILYYEFSYTYDDIDYADHYVEIPLVAFMGYRGMDEKRQEVSIKRGENDYILAYLTGKKGKIAVWFSPPILWKIGNVISLITFIIILLYRMRYEIKLIRYENKK